MSRKLIFAAVAGLIVGIILGFYALGNTIFQPKITDLNTRVSNLTSQVSKLEKDTSDQKSHISTLESQKTKLEADLTSTQSKLQAAEQTAVQTRTTLESKIADMQKRTDTILGINVSLHYEWVYRSETWKWDVTFPLSAYVQDYEATRPKSATDPATMAKNAKDGQYIDEIVRRVNDAAIRRSLTESDKINFVASFAQGLSYKGDKITTPYDSYPKYPVETLFDRTGDSEDTSILVAAILDRMSIDSAIIVLKNVPHMVVGVAIPYNWGAYYDAKGKRYYYLETTGQSWELGMVPPDITDRTGDVYTLR